MWPRTRSNHTRGRSVGCALAFPRRRVSRPHFQPCTNSSFDMPIEPPTPKTSPHAAPRPKSRRLPHRGPDVRDAVSPWYRNVLGFSLDREHERDGKLIARVSLRAGDVRILLTQGRRCPKGVDRVKGTGILTPDHGPRRTSTPSHPTPSERELRWIPSRRTRGACASFGFVIPTASAWFFLRHVGSDNRTANSELPVASDGCGLRVAGSGSPRRPTRVTVVRRYCAAPLAP